MGTDRLAKNRLRTCNCVCHTIACYTILCNPRKTCYFFQKLKVLKIPRLITWTSQTLGLLTKPVDLLSNSEFK